MAPGEIYSPPSVQFSYEPLRFAKLISCDLVAGLVAGSLVTPVISAVDRALAESASGVNRLWPSFFGSLREYASKPITYVTGPQFLYVLLIYGGTYVTANVVETACSMTKKDPAAIKWAATSTVNTTTCIVKDTAFARMFGASVPTNVPKGAYAAWLSRDFISMGVFFTLPPLVGEQISHMTGSKENGYYAAQIGLPLLLQTITGPIHLLGYDIYNRPNANVGQRIQFLKKDYWKNVSIRMVRMAPPWSFGTIGNREIRRSMQKFLGVYRKRKSVKVVYQMSG